MKPQPKSVPTYESRSFAAVIGGEPGAHKLRIKAGPYYRTFLNRLKLGSQVSIEITDRKPKRTEAQNRYLWVFYGDIARETGHSPEELHEYFKAEFLPAKTTEVFGKQVSIPPSTTNLTRIEFGEYIDKIASLTGVEPPPVETIRGL